MTGDLVERIVRQALEADAISSKNLVARKRRHFLNNVGRWCGEFCGLGGYTTVTPVIAGIMLVVVGYWRQWLVVRSKVW